MCGLFGSIGRPDDFVKAAIKAADRGPDSWGLAWTCFSNERQRLVMGAFTENGPLTASKAAEILPGVESLSSIGHARLATSGPGAQPLVCDQLAIAHNGNVANYDHLVREFMLPVETECDSEAIGWLIVHFIGQGVEPVEAVRSAVSLVDRSSRLSLLVLFVDRVVAVRRGHPLFYRQTAESVTIGSRRWHFDCRACPDKTAVEWTTFDFDNPKEVRL